MKKYLNLIMFFMVTLLELNAHETLQENQVEPTLLEYITQKGKKINYVEMNLQLVTTTNAEFIESHLDEMNFKLNRFRVEIRGDISKELKFHYKQSFNKYSNPYAVDNLSASLEYAYVQWNPSEKFKFTIGKQLIEHGGYEYHRNAMEVREYSEFNNLLVSHQAGISVKYLVNENHEINFQIVNNRTRSFEELYPTGLPTDVTKSKIPFLYIFNWNGQFLDQTVQLRYSSGIGMQSNKDYSFYLTCGQSYVNGPYLAYFDIMYTRQGLDQHGMISRLPKTPITSENTEYLSFISSMAYRFNWKWNSYIKGSYETARVTKSSGYFPKGLYRSSWNIQGSIEFTPTKKLDLFFFALYTYRSVSLKKITRAMNCNDPNTHRLSIGLVYTIPVF